MDYWPTARWKMVISDREGERWLEPSLPFALIGSHPCCEGRIDEIRVPPVAYFACCFDDSIEVWPVCPIAFPRWGLNEPEHSLAVGKHRVSLFHQSHRKWEKVAGRGNRPTNTFHTVRGVDNVVRQITLDWDGKNRKKTLDRRVLIMGDDHPSTLRLYGQGLTRCNYAVVSTGAS